MKSIDFIHQKPKKKEITMEQHDTMVQDKIDVRDDVIISGLNMELTDAIKDSVHEKAEKLFEHDDRIIRMRVELEYDHTKSRTKKNLLRKGTLKFEEKTILPTQKRIICINRSMKWFRSLIE